MHLFDLADECMRPLSGTPLPLVPRHYRLTFAATALAASSMLVVPTVVLATNNSYIDHRVSSCQTLINNLEKKYGDLGPVPYFSRDGRTLVKCLQIPKPPVRVISLNSLNPPRSLPAQKWSSPVCAEWHDADYSCTRTHPAAIINCHKSNLIDKLAPKTVVCNKSFKPDILEAFCSYLKSESLYYFYDGTSARLRFNEASLRHEYKIKERKWKTILSDGSNNISTKRNPALRAQEDDDICLSGFDSKSPKFDFSGLFISFNKK